MTNAPMMRRPTGKELVSLPRSTSASAEKVGSWTIIEPPGYDIPPRTPKPAKTAPFIATAQNGTPPIICACSCSWLPSTVTLETHSNWPILVRSPPNGRGGCERTLGVLYVPVLSSTLTLPEASLQVIVP